MDPKQQDKVQDCPVQWFLLSAADTFLTSSLSVTEHINCQKETFKAAPMWRAVLDLLVPLSGAAD